MTSKNKRLCIRVFSILAVTATIIYAGNSFSNKQDSSQINYKQMSTQVLQIEVEKLSNEGNLPFEMGLELMNRWQTEKSNIH